MKKRKHRKLGITGQTIRHLSDTPMKGVAGGMTNITCQGCGGGTQHTPMTEYPATPPD